MWVQLKVIKQVSINGASRQYYPGDWVEVGKQTALAWINAGDATIPDYKRAGLVPAGAGMLVKGDAALAERYKIDVKPLQGEYELPFVLTVIWDSHTPLKSDVIPAGLGLLQTWHIAAPMYDYGVLAAHLGTELERQQTAALIHDLRVPVYNPALVFIRRCSITRDFISCWNSELAGDGDPRLAFLRALWQVKPLILPLPFHWTSTGGDGYQ